MLVLIHGFPLSREAWRNQITEFGVRYRVLAPDLPGFGAVPPFHGPVTMARYAEYVKRTIDEAGAGRVVLAGHSMGGYIALAFAQAYPDRLRGLVLVATRPGPDTPEAAAGRRSTAEKVRTGGTGGVIDSMAPKMVADPALVPEVKAMMAAATPAGVIGALEGMADRPDSTDLLPTLDCPVWIVTGDADALIPHTESERMAALLPGSTLTLIPGAGHLVAYEQPDAFKVGLSRHLRRIG